MIESLIIKHLIKIDKDIEDLNNIWNKYKENEYCYIPYNYRLTYGNLQHDNLRTFHNNGLERYNNNDLRDVMAILTIRSIQGSYTKFNDMLKFQKEFLYETRMGIEKRLSKDEIDRACNHVKYQIEKLGNLLGKTINYQGKQAKVIQGVYLHMIRIEFEDGTHDIISIDSNKYTILN